MKSIAVAGLFQVLFAVSVVVAQDLPEIPKPQEEHEWLNKFVGEWESEMEASFGPDQPKMKCKGTMKSRSLGGFWVVTETKSEMMGMPVAGLQTIGYDPEAKKYVGTWVDSAFNHLWKYEGSVDETDKILTLEADGPNLMTGKTAKFRDVYEFKSKDHLVISSSMQGEDGEWVTFMNGNARRKKK